MDFNKYLKKQKLTPSAFANLHNFKQPTIWRIVNGKYSPRASTAIAISNATGGIVKIDDLLRTKAGAEKRPQG